MRVLSIIHYPSYGGPQNRNRRIIPPLKKFNTEVIVLFPDEQGNAVDILKSDGIQVVQLPLHRLRKEFKKNLALFIFLYSEVRSIRKIIQQHRIDLVLINGLVNPHGAIAARLEGIPVVWQILDTFPPMWLRKLSMFWVKRWADVVMSTGLKVAKEHPGALSFQERLISFYPPVDTNLFKPNAEAKKIARKKLDVPDEAFLIGMVGNLNYQKGQNYLIQAVSLIKKAIPHLQVRILGGHIPTQKNYIDSLYRLIKDLNLENIVQIYEPRDQVHKFLPAFDLFALTSRKNSEGIPTAVLEAMACGLPVVAVDVGSIKGEVVDEQTGIVVEPENPEQIAQAILRLYHEPELRQAMGQKARQKAVEQFDIKHCVAQHQKAFELALAWHGKKKN